MSLANGKGQTGRFLNVRVKSSIGHPTVLGSVVVLILNDHVLKGAGIAPAWLTGKLSDFAGLYFFPVLICDVGEWALRQRSIVVSRKASALASVAVTGVVFSLGKTVPAVNHLVSEMWGAMVCDPSDLLALPSLVLSFCYLTRSKLSIRVPMWAHLLAVIVAAVASMATSPSPYTRGFAVWRNPTPTLRSIGCARAEAWVSKSGKQGVGITLRFQSDDKECVLKLTAASLIVAEQKTETVLSTPVDILAGKPNATPLNPTMKHSHGFGPGVDDRGAYYYLPFVFDNQQVWNSGQHTSSLQVRFEIEGKEDLWEIPLEYQYSGYHAPTREFLYDIRPPASSSSQQKVPAVRASGSAP